MYTWVFQTLVTVYATYDPIAIIGPMVKFGALVDWYVSENPSDNRMMEAAYVIEAIQRLMFILL